MKPSLHFKSIQKLLSHVNITLSTTLNISLFIITMEGKGENARY